MKHWHLQMREYEYRSSEERRRVEEHRLSNGNHDARGQNRTLNREALVVAGFAFLGWVSLFLIIRPF